MIDGGKFSSGSNSIVLVAMHPLLEAEAPSATHEAKKSIPGNLEAKAMPGLRSAKPLGFHHYPTKFRGYL
jgi:hypothetical protein